MDRVEGMKVQRPAGGRQLQGARLVEGRGEMGDEGGALRRPVAPPKVTPSVRRKNVASSIRRKCEEEHGPVDGGQVRGQCAVPTWEHVFDENRPLRRPVALPQLTAVGWR